MGASRVLIEYPSLPVETGSRLALVKGAAWCVAAALLHGALYIGATAAAEAHRKLPKPRSAGDDDHIMIVSDFDMDEPVREEPEPAPEVEPPPEAPEIAVAQKETPKSVVEPRPVRKAERSPRPAPKAEQESPPSPEPFRDIGVMGSVDVGATGPGGSRFTVAVGNSGVGGPIGRSGRIEGIASPHATGKVMPPPPADPPAAKAVSIRNLSRKAKPNGRHNRKIKAPYPKQLREEDISGEVQALLIVLPDGTVGSVKILRSAHEAFAASAIDVLKQFLFEPALDRRGDAVTSRVTLTYRFTLE